MLWLTCARALPGALVRALAGSLSYACVRATFFHSPAAPEQEIEPLIVDHLTILIVRMLLGKEVGVARDLAVELHELLDAEVGVEAFCLLDQLCVRVCACARKGEGGWGVGGGGREGVEKSSREGEKGGEGGAEGERGREVREGG